MLTLPRGNYVRISQRTWNAMKFLPVLERRQTRMTGFIEQRERVCVNSNRKTVNAWRTVREMGHPRLHRTLGACLFAGSPARDPDRRGCTPRRRRVQSPLPSVAGTAQELG